MPLYGFTHILLFYLCTMQCSDSVSFFKVYFVSIGCICWMLVLRNKHAHLLNVESDEPVL